MSWGSPERPQGSPERPRGSLEKSLEAPKGSQELEFPEARDLLAAWMGWLGWLGGRPDGATKNLFGVLCWDNLE